MVKLKGSLEKSAPNEYYPTLVNFDNQNIEKIT
jgi:hypothetical protein